MTTGAHSEPGRSLVAEPWRMPALSGGAARELVEELAQAAVTTRTGVLRVTGEPGGDLQVVHGLVVTVDSPGAPGVRDLLARPGRICTGMADLRVVAMMAAVDGCFAITSGWIGGCHWQTLPADRPERGADSGEETPPVPGVEPGWLLLETDRRLCALAHGRVSPHRNRLLLTERGRMALTGPGSGRRQEILRWTDGRRSCRDISILLSRSLYAVTVDVVRLLDDGLLTLAPIVPETSGPPVPTPQGRNRLPRRRRGASGINDLLPPCPPAPRGQRALTPRRTERTP
ncbi:hypothetical protein D7D52_34525 [Nocardia yunnanensis]|uniref:MarR family transcriptional regulator n=1 Tax=Nocardia yunnanensis TaxID=2382165 RepID=A0A386ZJP2_9NOCA|nr:hypothetical protein [Nocardia yunnanensis]AYF78092.1 hypothetical protein D7D52_34525 [Nocardia yunnanensis]